MKPWYELISYNYDEVSPGMPTSMSYDEMVIAHVRSCDKAKYDEYCKVCEEY